MGRICLGDIDVMTEQQNRQQMVWLLLRSHNTVTHCQTAVVWLVVYDSELDYK